jgi:hypothetical protein
VEELKGLLQYLWPLVVLAAMLLLRGYFRQSAPGPQGQAVGVPSEEPSPAPFRVARPAEVRLAEGRRELPQEPETSPASQRRERAPDPAPVEGDPIAADAGHRLRRLLAHAEGRRVALLVHEVFRPPEGCGRT